MKTTLNSITLYVITLLAVSASDPPRTIRVGYLPATHDSLLFVADRLKLFPPETKVILVKYTSSPDILQEMRGEKIDIGIPGLAAPINSIANGAPFSIVGGAAQESAAVVVREEYANRFPDGQPLGEKLRALGKLKLASVKQSTGDALFRMATTNLAISLNDSYRNPNDILVDLKGEKLDGAVLWSPHMTTAQNQKMKIVLWMGEILPNHVCCRQVVRTDFLKQNPTAVRGYLLGLIRAMVAYQDPSKKAEVLKAVSHYVVNQPDVLLKELYNVTEKNRTQLSIDLNRKGIEQYCGAMVAGRLLKSTVVSSVYDNIDEQPLLDAYVMAGLSRDKAKKAVDEGIHSVMKDLETIRR